MKGRQLSIYRLIVMTIIVVVLSVMTANVSILYVTLKGQIVEDTHTQTLATLRSLRDNIAGFMDSYSINEYEKLVATEMANPSFYAIVVEDYHVAQVLGIDVYVSGQTRDKNWQPVEYDWKDPALTKNARSCFLEEAIEVTSQSSEVLGKITICISDKVFAEELQASILKQMAGTVLTSLLLIAALYFALRRTLLAPLSRISNELLSPSFTGKAVEAPHLFGFQTREISSLINAIKVYQNELNEQKEELSNERNRFDLAVQGSQDGLWDWDPSTNTVYFSSQWKHMLGFADDEIGNSFEEWSSRVHPDDLQPTLRKVEEHLKGKTDIYESKHRLKCKDGTWKWILARGKALFDQDGNPVRVVGFHTDITPQVQHERELSEARQIAEKANQAKSEFLAAMSHELRTPLNAILGFSQLMQYDPDAPLSEKQNDHVQSIIAGGSHLLDLVNEILDLARIEADRTPLAIEDVDIGEVVDECISLSQPLVEPRGITIINTYAPQSGDILRSDHKRVQQILLNLLSNASKYNREGGSITIKCAKTDNDFFRVSVTDTGVGIEKKDFPNVFEMFHRLHEDPHITRQGTGIGLNVSKLLVESMAGRIGFDSEYGVGSTFWFELPLASNADVLIPSDVKIGVDAIDKDHLFIAKLMNRISHQDFDKNELDVAISELMDYTLNHFRREEAILTACDYPEIEQHKALHVELRAKVMKLSDQWDANKSPETVYMLRDLLRNMWVDHVLKEDTKIAPYTEHAAQEIEDALRNLQ